MRKTNKQLDIKSIAIRCSSNDEEAFAIEYLLSSGCHLPSGWTVEEMSNDSSEYPYIAVDYHNEISAYRYADNKSVVLYSEFFSSPVECSDYDMVL